MNRYTRGIKKKEKKNMKNTNYRLSKDATGHFTSLESLREHFGLKPLKHKTADDDKLKKQQEQFLGKCKVCGEPLSYIKNTNILACTNPQCKGITVKGKSDSDVKIPVMRLLNEKGGEIAYSLFS